MQFYTVPFVSRNDTTATNAIFGFTSRNACVEYISDLIIAYPNEHHTPFMLECDLDELKSVSNVLKLPLIVEVAKIEPHNQFELYFYRDALKNTNIKDI
jgi:hypothetical protein